jgi:hypothetical protein
VDRGRECIPCELSFGSWCVAESSSHNAAHRPRVRSTISRPVAYVGASLTHSEAQKIRDMIASPRAG